MCDNYKEIFSRSIDTNFPFLKEFFKFKLNHFIELTKLRDEILKCLLLELYQSSIFSTNHLLERVIKLALINKYTINLNFNQPELYNEKTLEAIELYDDKKLSYTLNSAQAEKLITEKEFKTLNLFRDKIRNPYSHAQIKRIISGAPEKFTGFMFNINEVQESLKKGEPIKLGKKTEITTLSPAFAQIYQEDFSKQLAFDYFKIVNQIMINIDKRLEKLKTCT